MKPRRLFAVLLFGLLLSTCTPQPVLPEEVPEGPPVGKRYYADPAPLGERSLWDRVDEAQHLYQVHVLYVTLSDSIDYQRDLDGRINASLLSTNAWLAAQTGGSQLRFDTFQGELDITYVQLEQTSVEFVQQTEANFGSATKIRANLEINLERLGLLDPGKLYLALFEINQHPLTCAEGAHPPDVLGRVAALYPSALLDGGYYCGTEHFSDQLTFTDFGALHEILHTLGFASACGANSASRQNSAHTGDDTRDLMWGQAPHDRRAWDTANMLLDPGHDDYFALDDPDCLDLARSAFLDPLPVNAQLPPDWPEEWMLRR